MIGEVELHNAGIAIGRRVWLGRGAAVIDERAEDIVFLLVKRVEPARETVGAGFAAHISLSADIVRVLVPGSCHRKIRRRRIIVGQIEVIERGKREEKLWRDGMHPVGDHKLIALGLAVTEAKGTVVVGLTFVIIWIGIVRNLEKILAILRIHAQLVLCGLIANERDKGALRVRRIMMDLGHGRG